jgi:SAM-dependent methyltransferase
MQSRRHLPLLALALLLSTAAQVRAQLPVPLAAPGTENQKPAPPRRPTSTPYEGDLSIFETQGRDEKLHINKVMDDLGIVPGKNVADIGAGSGWFTVRAAKRVEPAGKVYAVDINPDAIEYISDRVKKDHIGNVSTIRSKEDNPMLPPGSVDSVLMLKTYHEVSQPVVLLRNLRGSLRPGARVGIIDRDGDGTDHGVHKAVVLHEADEAGYRLLEEHDDLVKGDKMDYFLVLAVK